MLRLLKHPAPFALLCLLLLNAATAQAQQFIGCRTAEGWADTPILRKTFNINTEYFEHYDFETLTFSLDVASLGYHEVYVNNTRVTDRVMQPAVSQLDKRVLARRFLMMNSMDSRSS